MNDDIQRIEMTIEDAERKVELAEKAEKLIEDKLFDEIISELYLGTDASRLALQLGRSKDGDARVYDMLKAKSYFSRFMANLIHEGQTASQAIAEHKELLAQELKDN